MASHAKQRLVVVGNGMAPGRALERLFETAPDAYDVTIFNAEPRVNYDRIMLSPALEFVAKISPPSEEPNPIAALCPHKVWSFCRVFGQGRAGHRT